MRTDTEWLRLAAAASVRSWATSSASGARGSVTTTSTRFSADRGSAAAPPPASRERAVATASAGGTTECRKRPHGTYAPPRSGARLAATLSLRADVAELVDALASGASVGNDVVVRIHSSAYDYMPDTDSEVEVPSEPKTDQE